MEYLRIKNWSKYQQIAGIRAEYVRIQTGILTDPEFLQLPERERLCFFLLLLYAGVRANKIPHDENMVMQMCWFEDPPNLDLLIEHELLEEWDPVKHQEMIDKYEEKLVKDRRRKRVPRGIQMEDTRKAADSALETETETETKTKTYIKHENTLVSSRDETAPKKSRKKPKAYTDDFERLWMKRPKRNGSDPKNSAFRAFNARLKDDCTVEEMEAGIERYAAYLKATGKQHTEYVQMLSTFLGPDEHFRDPWTPPAPAQQAGPGNSVPRDDQAAIRWGQERGINPKPGESMYDYRTRLQRSLMGQAV